MKLDFLMDNAEQARYGGLLRRQLQFGIIW